MKGNSAYQESVTVWVASEGSSMRPVSVKVLMTKGPLRVLKKHVNEVFPGAV